MLKKLWEKYRELFWEIFRFGLVGGVSFIFDGGTLMLIRGFVFGGREHIINLLGSAPDVNLLIATVLGFAVGVTVNYVLSVLFVFNAAKGKAKSKRAMIVFLLGAIIGLVLTAVIVQLGAAIFGGSDLAVILVKVFATFIVMFWNYISRKIFIFK